MRVGGCPGSASKLAANCPPLVQPACQRRRRETFTAANAPVSHHDATQERMRSSFEISAPKVHVTNTSRRMRSERTVQTNCADRGNELRNCATAKQPGRATSARPQLSFQRVAQCARARLPRPCSPSSTVHGDRPKLHAQRTRARRGPSRSVCSNPARSASRPSRGPRDGSLRMCGCFMSHVVLATYASGEPTPHGIRRDPSSATCQRIGARPAGFHCSVPRVNRNVPAHASQRASASVAARQRMRRNVPTHRSQRANASVATCEHIHSDFLLAPVPPQDVAMSSNA